MFIGTVLSPAINATVYLISYYKHCTNSDKLHCSSLSIVCE